MGIKISLLLFSPHTERFYAVVGSLQGFDRLASPKRHFGGTRVIACTEFPGRPVD